MFNPKTQLIDLNKMMDCIYSAIADQAIPVLTGFGNGMSQRFAERLFDEYPVLIEYYQDDKKLVNAFSRYTDFKHSL